MNTEIIKYKPENKNEILTIWETSVLATHSFLSHDDFIEIKVLLQSFNFEELNVFCQVEKGKIVGFIGVQENKIEMLFIEPESIGKGFGKDLIDFSVLHQNINQVDVNEQNIPAIKFYEKYGFEVYGRTEKDSLGKDYPILKMRLN